MVDDNDGLRPSPGCEACARREIPSEATVGRRTPTFTSATVPPGLLSEHHTNAWAALTVTTGSVTFTEVDPHWTTTATPTEPVVIVPGRTHHIEPSEDAEFWVQFYDLVHPPSHTASQPPPQDRADS